VEAVLGGQETARKRGAQVKIEPQRAPPPSPSDLLPLSRSHHFLKFPQPPKNSTTRWGLSFQHMNLCPLTGCCFQYLFHSATKIICLLNNSDLVSPLIKVYLVGFISFAVLVAQHTKCCLSGLTRLSSFISYHVLLTFNNLCCTRSPILPQTIKLCAVSST
jgi:hypothetical protein